jgi:quercetin dioxygenase-like cupin family protein
MQRKLALLLAFCLGMGLATAVAQKSKDSTIVDPDVHQVVLENDHIRVLEARAAAGRTSPMHTHPPLVLVSLGSARVKLSTPEGQTQIVDFRPGTVLWRDKPVEHSWELLAGDLHVVAVEVKSAQAARGD